MGYEHIGDKHPKVLNDKLFAVRGSVVRVKADDWNVHIEKFHWSDFEKGAFYCLSLAGLTEETYEKRCGEIHPRQCVFCKESVKDEEDREEHMEERHKVLCLLRGKKSLNVPLEVHVKREHKVREVSEICKILQLEPDTFKGFAPCDPADFLMKLLPITWET